MDKILEVNALTHTFKDKIIFDGLQFSINKSTTNLILGPNSCGKTTLIRLLCGIFKSNNNIVVNDISLNKRNLKDYLLSIGVIFFDDDNKFLFDRVIDELSFPLENLNYKKSDINKRINEVTDMLDLHNSVNKNIKDLNTYEEAKVLLALAIIHKPKIIFLDNALGKLSRKESQKLFTILNKIKKDITICITSNSIEDILLFDNVLVIGKEKILMEGTPKDILEQDNELTKLGILIPSMIDLSLKLGFYGLLDEVITDVDRMVDRLWK